MLLIYIISRILKADQNSIFLYAISANKGRGDHISVRFLYLQVFRRLLLIPSATPTMTDYNFVFKICL